MRPLLFASCLAVCVPVSAQAQSDDAPAREEASLPPSDEGCFPACRAGYLCHAGSCVEACNPPCGEGASCSASGVCEADVSASSGSSDVGPRDAGYAMGAGVMGIVMAALSIGLYATVAAGQLNYWVEVGLLWGAVGLPFITAPIVGGGALSASGPGVEGIVPLRVGAWIAYGLYFVAVAGTSIYSAENQGAIPLELAVTLAVFGVATELAFVVDAIYTGSQANATTSASVSAVPIASLVTSPTGVDGAVVGAAGRF